MTEIQTDAIREQLPGLQKTARTHPDRARIVAIPVVDCGESSAMSGLFIEGYRPPALQ